MHHYGTGQKSHPYIGPEVWHVITDFHNPDHSIHRYRATDNCIKLSYVTLVWMAAGGRTKAMANALKGWLTEVEMKHVLTYAEEVGNQGFPLSHQWL